MSFRCPGCENASLTIEARLVLPPDDEADERTVQILACARCPFRAFGTTTEERRGSRDRWSHTGWQLAEPDYVALGRAFAACGSPDSRGCACAEHTRLGAADRDGYWRPERRVGAAKDSFAIEAK